MATSNGELKQMENQRNNLRREISTDYRDIDDKYRHQLVKLKVCFEAREKSHD